MFNIVFWNSITNCFPSSIIYLIKNFSVEVVTTW